MSPYRRAKKEDAIKPSKMVLSVSIGSVDDSFESLQSMCNDKANELIKSIELKYGEAMQVVFWNGDIPELIGVADIAKNKSGLMTYSMDYHLNTLRSVSERETSLDIFNACIRKMGH